MASLTAKLPMAFDSGGTDVHRIQAVPKSTSVTDAVIDRFNLRDRYATQHREHARLALWEHCSTNIERKAGTVTLTCEDTDPKVATEIASYFGDVGNKVFGGVSASPAREERKFLEDQVQKARRDVDDVSRRLREFQEKNKVIDLPEQTKAVISAMASLKGELMSKELELSYLTSFSARTEANVVQLQQTDRHHEIEVRAAGTTGPGGEAAEESKSSQRLRWQRRVLS
jgi:capsule polysaccharide export protein KpsE/RkpR